MCPTPQAIQSGTVGIGGVGGGLSSGFSGGVSGSFGLGGNASGSLLGGSNPAIGIQPSIGRGQ